MPIVIGADPSKKAEKKRLYLFADFAVREAAPYWFDVLYKITKKPLYKEHAAKMRAVAPVVDRTTAEMALATARAISAAAAAAASYAAAAALSSKYRLPILKRAARVLTKACEITA